MLGLVFTEFVELVEDKFSPEIADAVIDEVAAPHGGAYTAVGYYPHEEMMTMVGSLSRQTGVPAPDLVRTFGGHLLHRFAAAHGDMFARHGNLFDFVASIHDEIHVEVRKLYDQAALPSFTVLSRDDRELRLLYQSPRAMEQLAQGLLEQAAVHYGEPCDIRHAPHDGPQGAGVLFTLVKRAP
ncbi:MAG: heme NO-binding domain-containing protein [Microbacteriaceae bacterium]|nr:heme NO-binding domain-containing protein [Burkholderiaceae bacterium]